MRTSRATTVRAVFRQLKGDGRGRILLTVAAGWFLFFGMRLVFPALLTHLRTAFSLSLTEAGLVLTILGLSYAVGQFPGGVLADLYGERAVMIGGAFAAAGSITLLILAETALALFAGTFIFGIAVAVFSPSRYVIVSKIYDASDGTAMSIVAASGNLGAAALPALAGTLAAYVSWQLGFGIAIPFFIATGIGIWFVVPRADSRFNGRSTSPEDRDSSVSSRTLIGALTKRPILLITAIMICHSLVFQGFTAFYPTYLIDEKGISAELSATLLGAFFALGVLMKLISGTASDLFGKKWTILVMLAGLGISLTIFPMTTGLLSIVLLTAFLTTLLAIAPIATAFLTNELNDDIAGSALGLLRTVYTAIGAISPILVGLLADVGRFDEAFVLLAAIAMVGAGLCALIRTGTHGVLPFR